jgi:hypothetical protein
VFKPTGRTKAESSVSRSRHGRGGDILDGILIEVTASDTARKIAERELGS